MIAGHKRSVNQPDEGGLSSLGGAECSGNRLAVLEPDADGGVAPPHDGAVRIYFYGIDA